MHRIEYNDIASADLLSLDKPVRNRILQFFNERVSVHPDPKQLAKPLHGKLSGLHRFRIGDYRAVCHVSDRRLVVLLLLIDHRSQVYKRDVPEGWDDTA